MNDVKPGWVEQMNSGTRSLVTVMLVATFCFLALNKTLDGAVFAQTVASVTSFWFAARALTAANGNGKSDTTTTTTTAVSPSTNVETVTRPAPPPVTG